MDNTSFVMHKDYLEGIPEDEQLLWVKHICNYAFEGIEPKLTHWLEKKVWGNIKSRIDADREAYDKRVQNLKQYRAKKYGTDSGVSDTDSEPIRNRSVENNTERTPALNTQSDSEFKSVSDSVFVSEFKSESVFESEFVSESDREVDSSSPAPAKKGFLKPTPEEVKAYVSEKSYTFDPGAFYSFYESNGWKVGKNAMKDWKAACKTWQQREKESGHMKKQSFDAPTDETKDWEVTEW